MSAFLDSALGKWTGIVIAVLTGALAQTLMKLGTRQVGSFGGMPFFAAIHTADRFVSPGVRP